MPLERLHRFRLNKASSDVDRALRFVVRSAYANIPAYRRLLDAAGVSARDLRGVEDLSALPVVRREAFFLDVPLADRIHRRADPSKCARDLTSGSQGIPISVYMARSEALFRKLLLLRAWGRGIPLRFPLTVIDVGTLVNAQAAVEVRWHGAIRVVRVSIASLNDADIGDLARFRGAVLSGFPSSLSLLAERVVRESSALSVKLVATRGEILHDAVRNSLGKAFGCKVMDFYNCEEVGNIASQCPVNPHALHVNTDGCVVEIVDKLGARQPDGSPGRILVTNLYNCTMPFIRYDLQDRGAFLAVSGDRCACGSTQATMEVVQGRDDDHLLRTDGHRVSPRLVETMVDRAVDELRINGTQDTFCRRYQVVQDAREHVTVRVVPIPHVGLCIEESISAAFRKLDPRMHCDVVFVDDLPAEPSGKFRTVMRTFGSAGE